MTATLIQAGQGSQVAQTTFAGGTVNFASSTGTPGVGDLMIVCMSIRSGAGVPNTPSGWTRYDGLNPTSGQKMYLFTRIRAAGDANSFTWTATTGGTTNGTTIVQAYYIGGADDASPVEVTPVWTYSTGTSSTVAGPMTGVTSLTNDGIALCFWARQDDAGTFTSNGGGWILPTLSGMQLVSASGTDAAMGIMYQQLPTAGASGNAQVNIASGSAFHWMGCTLIVKQQTGTGLLTVTGEAGADEANVGVQTSGEPNVAIVVGTGTTKYDTAQFPPGHGSKSIRHTVAAQQQRYKINAKRPGDEQFAECFMRITAFPSTSTRVASLEGYNGTDYAQVRISSAGLINIANDGAAINASTPTGISINTWFRFAWRFLGPAGTAEVRLFKGADLENPIANYSEIAQISGLTNGEIGRVMFGPGTANFTADIWVREGSIKYTTWVDLGLRPTLTQARYRFYQDNSGSEATNTPFAAENDPLDVNVAADDTEMLLRIGLQETGGISGDSTDDYQLQYAVNGGSFADLPLSGTTVKFSATGVANGAATTNRLTAGTGSFVAGEHSSDGVVDDVQITANNYTELLYSIGFHTGVTHGDVYTFRVVRNSGIVLDTYSQTPQVTVWEWPEITIGTAFRFYEAGSESGSSTIAGVGQTTNFTRTITANDNLQFRTRIQNNQAVAGLSTDDYQLKYSLNGGAYTNIGSGPVLGDSSSVTTDGGATTNRLTGGSGSFHAGVVSEDGLADNFQLQASNFTELLFPITLVYSALANGDTITFRVFHVQRDGFEVNNVLYGGTFPTITIDKSVSNIGTLGIPMA